MAQRQSTAGLTSAPCRMQPRSCAHCFPLNVQTSHCKDSVNLLSPCFLQAC